MSSLLAEHLRQHSPVTRLLLNYISISINIHFYIYIYRSVISAIPDADLPDQEIVSTKHGRLLTLKTIHDFKLRPGDVPQLAQVPGEADPGLPRLRTLARQEFSALLRDGRLAHLLDSNMLHMNWVPVVLGTEVRAGLCAFK